MAKETKTDRKYNLTAAAFWRTKTDGNAITMPIDERSLKQIVAVCDAAKELGGKLLIRMVPETRREKFPNPETAPNFFLEYMSKEEVEKFAAQRAKKADEESL